MKKNSQTYTTIKHLVVIIDFFIAFSGLAILITRSVYVSRHSNLIGLDCFVNQDYYTVITFGVLAKVIAIFGIYVTCMERRKLIILYSFLVSLLVVASLGNSLYHAIMREQKEDFNLCNRNMYEHILKINSSDEGKQNEIQLENKCCGWNSTDNYLNISSDEIQAPKSCCTNHSACQNKLYVSDRNLLFNETCSSKLLSNNKTWKILLYTMVSSFAVLTFLSMWFSLYLAFNTPKKRAVHRPILEHRNKPW